MMMSLLSVIWYFGAQENGASRKVAKKHCRVDEYYHDARAGAIMSLDADVQDAWRRAWYTPWAGIHYWA